MAEIALRGIAKSFGETRVLKDVDLEIADGEFLTLVGPSGCGKSTLLRIIAGLEEQSAGDVLIGRRNVNQTRPSARDLAMVFQSYALYPHLTVRQNMLTPLRLRDLSLFERLPLVGMASPRRPSKVRAMRDAVLQTAETLRIAHLLERKPGQLSGGQRQRVALGRAMVRKPVAFLMDEPLSNLDAALRVHMRSELAELHRSLATTFIYVTHDQAEALTMSDRIVVMMDGEVLQVGPPQALYADPADLRVAEFIGSPKINILPGEIEADGGVVRIGRRLGGRATGARAGAASIGVRPEHLEITHTSGGDALTGRLIHRENLGSDLYLHLALADGAHRVVARAAPDAAMAASIGDEISVVQTRGEVLVFDSEGRRVLLKDAEPQPLAQASA